MLEPSLMKKSTWYQNIGLEEPIAQASTNHPLFSVEPYDPPRFPENPYNPPFLRCSSTLNLDARAKSCIGVYDLLQRTSNKSQIAFSSIFLFLALGFLGFCNFLQNFCFRVSAAH
jgi:hypothetical protein